MDIGGSSESEIECGRNHKTNIGKTAGPPCGRHLPSRSEATGAIQFNILRSKADLHKTFS